MTGWRKRQIGEHMTKDETLKLALEALETAEIDGNCEYGATEIIRKALAQPEQRPWVGLTEEEAEDIWRSCAMRMPTEFAKALEAKLKEKNT